MLKGMAVFPGAPTPATFNPTRSDLDRDHRQCLLHAHLPAYSLASPRRYSRLSVRKKSRLGIAVPNGSFLKSPTVFIREIEMSSTRHHTQSTPQRKSKPVPAPQTDQEHEPNPETVDSIVEMLTRRERKYYRLVTETFRELWDQGELRALARLYKAVHRKYLAAVRDSLPEALDREDKARNEDVLNKARKWIHDLLSQATHRNTKVLKSYFRESCPLTDEQRKHFGRLWGKHERDIRNRAKLTDAQNADELLSDTVAELIKQKVFGTLAPEYDDDHFLSLVYACMRTAKLSRREQRSRRHRNVGRYLVRKGWSDAAEKARSKVVEYVIRQESMCILLDHIARIKSKKRRDAVLSIYFDGESPAEVAKRWGTTEKGPNNASSRGIEELRKVIPLSMDPGGYTSPQISARMTLLRDRGESFASIGKKFGVTFNAVRDRIRRYRKLQTAGRVG